MQILSTAYTYEHTHVHIHTLVHTLMQLGIIPIPARSPTQRDRRIGQSGRVKWIEERMERQGGERMEGFIGYMSGEGEKQLQVHNIYPAQQDN